MNDFPLAFLNALHKAWTSLRLALRAYGCRVNWMRWYRFQKASGKDGDLPVMASITNNGNRPIEPNSRSLSVSTIKANTYLLSCNWIYSLIEDFWRYWSSGISNDKNEPIYIWGDLVPFLRCKNAYRNLHEYLSIICGLSQGIHVIKPSYFVVSEYFVSFVLQFCCNWTSKSQIGTSDEKAHVDGRFQ